DALGLRNAPRWCQSVHAQWLCVATRRARILTRTESSVTNSTSRIDTTSKRARFRQLHAAGCFVLPNPWDSGSARRLEKLGFAALASSSAGMAWALGRDDYGVPRDLVLDHLRML